MNFDSIPVIMEPLQLPEALMTTPNASKEGTIPVWYNFFPKSIAIA